MSVISNVRFIPYSVAVVVYYGPLPCTLNCRVFTCVIVPVMMQGSIEIRTWEQHSTKCEAVDQNNALSLIWIFLCQRIFWKVATFTEMICGWLEDNSVRLTQRILAGTLCLGIPNRGCNAIPLGIGLATLPRDVTSPMNVLQTNCKGLVASNAHSEGSGLKSVSGVCIPIDIMIFCLCSVRVILQIGM
jgi:hypothetical protein